MTLDPARSPLFVVGTGRSGTTLLRLMLCAHPRIHLTHEASFYVWEKLAGKKASGEAVLATYLPSAHFRWLRLDPRPLVADLPRPLPRAELHRFYTALMQAQAARYGKPRWGDKTPTHASHLGRIFEDYPDARVVRIVRDPRTTVASFRRMPWASASWAGGAALLGMERRDVAPFEDRILQVRLEDLLADPRAVMGQVLEHVGEPWDDAVLAHHEHLPDPDDTPDLPWFRSAGRPLTPFRAPDWDTWDPVTLRLVEWLTRKAMVDGGYTPASLPTPVGWWARTRAWLADMPAFLHGVKVAGKMIGQAKDPSAEDDGRNLAVLKTLNPGAWSAYPGFEWPLPPPLPEGWSSALSVD